MTTTTIPTSPKALCDYLTMAEVDASRAPDCRRVLTDERIRLTGALRGGEASAIRAAAAEAHRVAVMWQGY